MALASNLHSIASRSDNESLLERFVFLLGLGRCVAELISPDIDTVDNLLGGQSFFTQGPRLGTHFNFSDALRMFASTLSAILGAIILISIVLPWFLIGVVCVSVIYVYAAIFYRASARELKVSASMIFIHIHV